MPETRFKTDAFEAIHSAVSGLYGLKIINTQTMHAFNEACIDAAPQRESGDIVPQQTEVGSFLTD